MLENNEHGRVDLLRLRLASRTGAPNWSIEKRYLKVLLHEIGHSGRAIAELQDCLRTQWLSRRILATVKRTARENRSRGASSQGARKG
jgi:hypothetical protein